MNEVFANYSDKVEIYPLTTAEITEAQRADASLKHLFKRNVCVFPASGYDWVTASA
jgi:hypothetical protein